ncbi:uncharacterized protein F5147DRAFT_740281 [Suillus discolor]|uniref:Uncharacterized protein n=1 Tax=Suillus discolor TaxID=1912936 RepID=A0A9P7EQY7_9AGAM|nr:uncharacterized protein F5147DRAFT_740281 [Suillus discolor]KAG2079808.1 hypothetical protein F5147DRAFT_740281 [Suillus discolor]
MTIQTVTKCSGSAVSINITDGPALSLTNRLTPAERKAFGNSDHKAAKILGITLTTQSPWTRMGALLQSSSANEEVSQVYDKLGEMMALGSRSPSAVTIFKPRKGLVMDLIEKNKKRRVAREYTQRVVLGPLRFNEPPVEEGKELSTTVNDDGALTKRPLACKCQARNNEDLLGSSRDFVWDVQNPFATPPNAVLRQYCKTMQLGEMIGPLDIAPPVASLGYTTNFEPSPEEISAPHSDDSFDNILRPAEQAYLDFLIAQDEAEEHPMERRRQRRAAVRSRNKILDVLGAEARQAVDGQC